MRKKQKERNLYIEEYKCKNYTGITIINTIIKIPQEIIKTKIFYKIGVILE